MTSIPAHQRRTSIIADQIRCYEAGLLRSAALRQAARSLSQVFRFSDKPTAAALPPSMHFGALNRFDANSYSAKFGPGAWFNVVRNSTRPGALAPRVPAALSGSTGPDEAHLMDPPTVPPPRPRAILPPPEQLWKLTRPEV
jgi:hypothetical protein